MATFIKPDSNDPMTTVFQNSRLLDPASGLDKIGALLVVDGRIKDMICGTASPDVPDGARIIDCCGHALAPGLIDMKVFVGEPGFEHRETLAGASKAAATGGITTIICRSDTNPVIDDAALVDYIRRRARDHALVHVYPTAALTRSQAGMELTEIGLLSEAGAIAFGDGTRTVANARVMRNALTYAKNFDALIAPHVEDPALADDGVMNEGAISARLGLPGRPASAEVIAVERDMRLVELTGGRYHASSISCADSVKSIVRAKDSGHQVTCAVSINNLILNERDVGAYRTFFKLLPPLRSELDREVMVSSIADGRIDIIVSDHDPQDTDSKRRPFVEAGFGAVGLETLLPAAIGLYHNGHARLLDVLGAMTSNPAKILGLETGRLAKGLPADLVLIDLDCPWVAVAEDLVSKCRNTTLERRHLQGRALMTMVDGKIVHQTTKLHLNA
jgi:dihydroorotase